jgi:hypothetical protein
MSAYLLKDADQGALYDSNASVMKIPKARIISTGCQLNSLWFSINCAVGKLYIGPWGSINQAFAEKQTQQNMIVCLRKHQPVCADGPICCYILAGTDTPQLMHPDRDNDECCHSYSSWSDYCPTWTLRGY